MPDFIPLTPDVRDKAISYIDEQLEKLNSCKSNAFVNMYRQAYLYERKLIAGLPDGYPMPVKKE